MFNLTGKTAIVTGGAHGIGQAICDVFARAGACVLVADIDVAAGEATVQRICECGGAATFCRTDVSSANQIGAIVEQAITDTGHIDIVCSNAAYITEFHRADSASSQEWEQCIQVTVLGARYLVEAALPHMIRQESGVVIIISSAMALVGGPDSIAYMTAKAGLLGLARSVAYDYGRYHIRANVVCPGAIRTRISPPIGSAAHQWQVARTMVGHVGKPMDVAYAALYLASDEAEFVTGIVLPVDGGYTAM